MFRITSRMVSRKESIARTIAKVPEGVNDVAVMNTAHQQGRDGQTLKATPVKIVIATSYAFNRRHRLLVMTSSCLVDRKHLGKRLWPQNVSRRY